MIHSNDSNKLSKSSRVGDKIARCNLKINSYISWSSSLCITELSSKEGFKYLSKIARSAAELTSAGNTVFGVTTKSIDINSIANF